MFLSARISGMIAMDIGDQDQIGGGESVLAASIRIELHYVAFGPEHQTGVLDRCHGACAAEVFRIASGWGVRSRVAVPGQNQKFSAFIIGAWYLYFIRAVVPPRR